MDVSKVLTSWQSLGYDASMMNALNILPSYTDYFHLTAATIGLNSGIVWIGTVVGSLLFAKVPDLIGRKPALFYSALVAIIGSALQAASQHIAMFLVARFVLGLGLGGTYIAGPTLIAETLPMKYRTIGLGAFTDLYYVGGLLSAGTPVSLILLSCDRTADLVPLLSLYRHHLRHVQNAVNMGLASTFPAADRVHARLPVCFTLDP